MSLLEGLRRWWEGGRTVADLAGRLDLSAEALAALEPTYDTFTIEKRAGGVRRIAAPDRELKRVQRRILRRLLARLRSHEAAMGFERGRSIVTHAERHTGQAVVIHLDLEGFFPATSSEAVRRFLRAIGWGRRATDLLVRLTTHEGGLPQGAPTSPRLSNLVNVRLDARLAGLAHGFGARYSRYADDLTFSFSRDVGGGRVRELIGLTERLCAEHGYRVHRRKKRHVRRRHHRQSVTGLVVNAGVRLPRETRRWLRAVEHRAAGRAAAAPGRWESGPGPAPTLTPERLAGWRAFRAMVERGGA